MPIEQIYLIISTSHLVSTVVSQFLSYRYDDSKFEVIKMFSHTMGFIWKMSWKSAVLTILLAAITWPALLTKLLLDLLYK